MGFNTDVLGDENISPYGKLVYFALSKYVGKDGTCWPSFSTLATITGISRRSVIRAIDELADSEWIVKQKRKAEFKNSDTNLYILQRLASVPDNSCGSDSQTLGSDSQTLGWCLTGTGVVSDSHPELIHITYPINNNISEDEKHILEYLPGISNYPFNEPKDLLQVREWLKSYPVDHILNELKVFNAWWRDNGDRFKNPNYRSRITTWLKKSKVEVKPISKINRLT